MRKLLFVILSISYSIHAQEINQFDTNGQRHGTWKKEFEGTNALRYQGQFKHGKEIGLFKFYKYISGKSVLSATKQFNENNDISRVKFYSSKGKLISEGLMHGKKYIGEWKYYHKNSNQLLRMENYDEQGNQQGELMVYYENGKLAEKSFYENGKLQGISIWYNDQGVVIKELNYDKGELHGLAKHFTNSGSLIIVGEYKRDKKHGLWKYYENGKLVKEKNFTKPSKNPYKTN